VARIADLYVAHRGMATAEVGSVGHTQARQAFDQALATMDTVRRDQAAIHSLHPAAKKVLATSTGNGTASHATVTSPTPPWTTIPPSGPCAPRWSAGRTTTAATPSGPLT
jgi:hypothetical protein